LDIFLKKITKNDKKVLTKWKNDAIICPEMEKEPAFTGRKEEEMDRSNKYLIAIEKEEAGYRDYFAELISFVIRALSSVAFFNIASLVCFVSAFLLTLGVVGGIECDLIPYAAGIPLSVMLGCVLLLIEKLRK
jgi:hypothetical protein